jgi:6-phosphofructokinase 2
MPVIVTLTMNPAIDVSTATERVEPGRKLRCSAERRDAGGGGINVARVAARLGAEVTAVYPIGGLAGQLLKGLVDAEGVESIAVPVHGETREDFTILDEIKGEQYRFVLPGPHLYADEWMGCLEAVSRLGRKPDLICASGSLPPGAPDDFYAQLAQDVEARGLKLVLDTSGAALKCALEAGVYLIKPNLREMMDLTGATLDDEASSIRACRRLIERGGAEVVALTLGGDGALLVTEERAWRASALSIHPVSTVGAGDSFLGAMVWALGSGLALEESFRYAVAGGSAAVLAEGTELCRPQDVRRLLGEVVIEEIPDQRAPAVSA